MKTRKLTPEQIDDLFAFCEEQDVPYYDVQIELVDHLASAIEQKWTEKPALTYDEALWQVYDNFGVSGFRKIRRRKERALNHKYLKIRMNYISGFFKLPKIVLAILATITLSVTFIKFGIGSDVTSIVLLIYLVPFAFSVAKAVQKENKICADSDKRFLLISKLNELKTTAFAFYVLPFWWVPWFRIWGKSIDQATFKPWGLTLLEIGASVSIVLFSIALWVSYVYLPRKIKADFTREYPQFVIS